MDFLKYFFYSGETSITDKGIKELASLPNLHELDLSDSVIKDVNALKKLTGLKSLN